MDTTTLMMMMMAMGGRSNNMMLPLMLMMMGGTTSQSLFTPQNVMLGLLPGVGTVGKVLLGGVGAAVVGNMFKRRTYRRRTRVIYRNRYRRYRRY